MNEFIGRVVAERRILRAVNGHCGKPSLSGLSAAAIASWISQNRQSGAVQIDRLQSLATKLGSICDKSGEHFDRPDNDTRSHLEADILQFEHDLGLVN